MPPLICPVAKTCKMKKRREEGLVKHMKKCNLNPKFKIIKCPISGCGGEVCSMNGLKNHIKIFHMPFAYTGGSLYL